MFKHRPLAEEDLATIASFPQSEDELFYVSPRFLYPLTAEQIARLLQDRHAPTVIVDSSDGSAAGYANLYDRTSESCWLGNVIIAPSYRGTGAAAALIEAMKRLAKTELGVRRLQLSCHQSNARGLVFYHKCGFKPYDMRIAAYGARGKIITIQMAISL